MLQSHVRIMTRCAVVVLLAGLFATNEAYAQSGALLQAELSGQVTVNGTGTPIPNVNVLLFELIDSAPEVGGIKPDTTTKTEQTDAAGRFVFRNLTPGPYRVVAFSLDFIVDAYSRQVVRVNGGEMRVVTLRLREGGKLAGRVVDPAGRVVRGATIQVIPADRNRLSTALLRDIHTSERGEFTASPLEAGQYLLLAIPSGEDSVVPSTEILAETYYPSTLDRSKAALVDVVEGKVLQDVVITLETAWGFSVSGSVVDNRGQPAGQVQVELTNGRSTRFVRTQDDGHMTFFGVAAGSYSLALMSAEQVSVPGGTVIVSFPGEPTPIEVIDADVSGIRLVKDSGPR